MVKEKEQAAVVHLYTELGRSTTAVDAGWAVQVVVH